MQFRPSRVVTVTTQEELDSAFASADELIVEGDDALLSYAATKASGDPGSQVEIQAGIAAVSVGAPQIPPRRRQWLSLLAAILVLVVALAGAGIYFFEPFPNAAAPPPPHYHHAAPHPAGGGAGSAELPSTAPDLQPAETESPSEWMPLMWPVVSIVAILALFLIARQAIAGGRNVEISWKVTEKVSGRVVITKVRTPGRRQRAVA